jgi:predicted alpha/beta hydrolase family esterase
MTNYFIVPGLGNSGEEHWQTFFEKSGNNFHRILQKEWDAPDCIDWVSTIDQVISACDPETVILIGHSLGCSTIAHWANLYHKKIKGALLVAPSDIELPRYTFPAKGFTPIPTSKINFRTIVVASTDDEWVSIERAELFATNWGSDFINIGKAGHINAASGYGQWQQGLEILKTLV